MGRYILVALFWLACATVGRAADYAAECTWREQAARKPATSTSLKLLKMTPRSGAEARRDTVLVLDLEFQVEDFQPDKYFPAVLFRKSDGGFLGSQGFLAPHYFEHAAGKARFCVPIAALYEKDNIRWPLEALVMLMGRNAEGSISVSDRIEIRFQSPDAPVEKSRRDPPSPPATGAL